jgi:hypothetical protein
MCMRVCVNHHTRPSSSSPHCDAYAGGTSDVVLSVLLRVSSVSCRRTYAPFACGTCGSRRTGAAGGGGGGGRGKSCAVGPRELPADELMAGELGAASVPTPDADTLESVAESPSVDG